jgi:hypothetical protein
MMERITQLGQDSQDQTSRRGQPENVSPKGTAGGFRTARIVQPGQNIRNRTGKTCLKKQYIPDRTAMTRQSGKNKLDRTARTV